MFNLIYCFLCGGSLVWIITLFTTTNKLFEQEQDLVFKFHKKLDKKDKIIACGVKQIDKLQQEQVSQGRKINKANTKLQIYKMRTEETRSKLLKLEKELFG